MFYFLNSNYQFQYQLQHLDKFENIMDSYENDYSNIDANHLNIQY